MKMVLMRAIRKFLVAKSQTRLVSSVDCMAIDVPAEAEPLLA